MSLGCIGRMLGKERDQARMRGNFDEGRDDFYGCTIRNGIKLGKF